MSSAPHNLEENARRNGIMLAVAAYTFWGFFPIYFKLMAAVPPLEILTHRLVWALPFGAIIVLARGQWPQVKAALQSRKTLGLLSLSAFFIALNWGTYIWAVHSDQIMQASLGYYINPLIYVIVGVIFLKEELNGLQVLAVALAFFGVGWLMVSGGELPLVTLILAVSFTIYGVIRKQVVIAGMPGLFVETLLLFPIGCAYMIYLSSLGTNTFGTQNLGLSGGLMLAGPLTVLPLLAFALAARRLPLATIGILQFIGPTLQFGVALYYGEPLTGPRVICFGFIWTAVLLYCIAARRKSRAAARAVPPA